MQPAKILNERILQQSTSTSSHFEAPPYSVWSCEMITSCLNRIWRSTALCFFGSQSSAVLTLLQLPPCLHIYKSTFDSWCFLLNAGRKNNQRKNATSLQQSTLISSILKLHASIWLGLKQCNGYQLLKSNLKISAVNHCIGYHPRFNSWGVFVIAGIPKW